MVSTEILIRDFEAGDEDAFRRLNEEWIVRFFALEAKDEYAFANPRKTILDHGGRIFFAVRDEEMIGCCALVAMGPGEFEIAKMAVTESSQRGGVGRRLLQHAVDEGREMGATRLYLETNSRLVSAISLYEQVGFRHLPVDRRVASPYARANVFMEMLF